MLYLRVGTVYRRRALQRTLVYGRGGQNTKRNEKHVRALQWSKPQRQTTPYCFTRVRIKSGVSARWFHLIRCPGRFRDFFFFNAPIVAVSRPGGRNVLIPINGRNCARNGNNSQNNWLGFRNARALPGARNRL